MEPFHFHTYSTLTLTLRPLPQPEPATVTGGDCAACVLAGLSNRPLADIYELARPNLPPDGLNWSETVAALQRLTERGHIDRAITAVPNWPVEPALSYWGASGYPAFVEWYSYVRLGLEAGYYGVIFTHIAPSAQANEINHVELICGARERPVDDADGSYSAVEVLVACPKRHNERWLSALELLRLHGGWNVILVKPVVIPPVNQ